MLLASPAVRGGLPPPQTHVNCPSFNGPFTFYWDEFDTSYPPGLVCGNENCDRAELRAGPSVVQADPLCDPQQPQGCTLRLLVPLTLRGVKQNHQTLKNPWNPRLYWFTDNSPPGSCTPTNNPFDCAEGLCGEPGGSIVDYDEVDTYFELSGLKCPNPSHGQLGVYSLSVFTCWDQAACLPASQRRQDYPLLDFTPFAAGLALGCFKPRMDSCDEGTESSCPACVAGGASVGGNGPSVGSGSQGEGNTGPNATLRYLAGGAGTMGAPGSSQLSLELGRHWMHDYAERIIVDPDPGHIWMISRHASYREFTDGDSDGLYEPGKTGTGYFFEETNSWD